MDQAPERRATFSFFVPRGLAMSYTSRTYPVVPGEDDMATAETVRTTREEYVRLVEAGVFEGRRVELIDGVVYEMTPQLSPHAATVMLAQDILREVFSPPEFSVRCQMPLDVGTVSMPEPDLAIVPGTPRDYYAAHPTRAALVLEVTDTTQDHDRKRKARIYAEAGIQDYWIINLARDVLEVYRDPMGNTYRTQRILRRGEQIAPLGRPDAMVAAEDLLPIRP